MMFDLLGCVAPARFSLDVPAVTRNGVVLRDVLESTYAGPGLQLLVYALIRCQSAAAACNV